MGHVMDLIDVIIIGAGHAGLSVSYYLCKNDISNIIFEKGRIGESWRSQRWDSFVINTPSCINILPESYSAAGDPDCFIPGKEYASFLTDYTNRNNLPVNENSEVISVELVGNFFSVTVNGNNLIKQFFSRQVIIASGALSTFNLPPASKNLSNKIFQIHAADYRNSDQLPEGRVLVVGGAQSGCQVAEDLALSGRDVLMASCRVARIPRRYRGKDITYWLTTTKFFDTPTDSITDPQILKAAPPQISGTGKMGHTVSYQYLKSFGVRIFGHLNFVDNNKIFLGADSKANVKFADESSQMIKSFIDDFIAKSGIVSILHNEHDPADIPDTECLCAEDISLIHCDEEKITSVIWCTGFSGDFSYIRIPAVIQNGLPVHHNGISPVKGLYFLGFPWLRTRKSGVIYGISEDAEVIANEVAANIKTSIQRV